MAGEGGFSTKPMGFDKNEVNQYISNLRKTMKDMEAEKKNNEERTAIAVKMAESAENRIKAVEEKNAEKIAELELQIKTERRNAESLTIQIDELKRKLKQKSGADGSAAGGASIAAAQKQSAEIVAKANKTASDIVEKAKKTANNILASARNAAQSGSGGAGSANVEAFMSVLKGYLDSITGGFNEVNRKAEELLGSGAASAHGVTMPDFSNISAPQASVPTTSPAVEHTISSEPEMTLSGSLFDTMEDDSDDDMSSAFGDEVSMINPKTPKAEVLEGFDLSHVHEPAVDEPVDAVTPIDTDNVGRAEFNNDFMKELIAQTVPSSALGNEVDEDLLAAVKDEEAKYAVQPTDADKGMDFDMDMGAPAADSGAADSDDPMAALLAQAAAAFGGGGSLDMSEPEREPEPEPSNMGMGGEDWADLQKQLEAMEQSGGFGDSASEAAAEPAKNTAEDPKAPSADDSSIWNFGDMGGSSDDDDMSSDLFGSF